MFEHLLQNVKTILYPAISTGLPLLESLLTACTDPVLEVGYDLHSRIYCGLPAGLLLGPLSDILAGTGRESQDLRHLFADQQDLFFKNRSGTLLVPDLQVIQAAT